MFARVKIGIDICNVMQNSCVGAYKDDDVSNSFKKECLLHNGCKNSWI